MDFVCELALPAVTCNVGPQISTCPVQIPIRAPGTTFDKAVAHLSRMASSFALASHACQMSARRLAAVNRPLMILDSCRAPVRSCTAAYTSEESGHDRHA